MKMSYLLAAALILFSLVSVSFAAESVEIRSEILTYDGYWNDDDFAFLDSFYYGYSNNYYIPADNWAAMYYDLKNDISTEFISIYGVDDDGEYLNPGHLDFVYYTSPMPQKFEYNWTVPSEYEYDDFYYIEAFAVLGFFGEPYVALNNETILIHSEWYESWHGYQGLAKANKIAPLVINDDEKYSLKVGDTIDLGQGYTLFVEQIDVKGNKTNLVLKHNDTVLNSSVVNASESGDWNFKTDVLDEKKVQVLRVHVKDVFQGKDAIVEIDGLWLVDYLNAFEVKSDVDYGKWNATSIGPDGLEYVAEDIALSSNATISLGKNWSVKVQDGFEIPTNDDYENNDYIFNNRFYLFKEYTELGKYDVRSSVSYDNGGMPYTYHNFAAFYYDLDKNLATELLYTYANYNRQFEKENPNSFLYMTTYIHTDYEYLPRAGFDESEYLINSWDSGYDIMGYFGEKYVPLNVVDNSGFYIYDSTKLDKFAPLIMDDDSKYTLKTGDWIELGSGYTLYISQIDIDGNKAYLELHKDNKLINSSIITTNAGKGSGNWIYQDTVLNIKNVQLLRVHVKDVFQGQDEFVEIDGIWLTDFKNVTDLKSDDEVGLLKYEGLYPIEEFEYEYYNADSYHSYYSDYHGVSYSAQAFSNLDAESVLIFTLKNNLTLTDDMDQVVANNMALKAYLSDGMPPLIPTLARSTPAPDPSYVPDRYIPDRYYFYVTEEIGNLSSGDGDGGNGEDDGNDDGSDDNSGNPDNPDNEDSPSDLTNGFGAIVLGLLLLLLLIVAAYLYRRYMSRKAQTANQNEADEK